jgi:hypothetical protein
LKGFSIKQQDELAAKYIPLDKPFTQRDYKGYARELRKTKKDIQRQGD